MKKVLSVLLMTAFLVPVTSQALSCVDLASMIEQYVSEPSYTVFTGVAGEMVEHVRQAADATGQDPNRSYNDGYTAQYVSVTEVHKGSVPDELWVYHQQNGVWGYMCSGGPADAGVEALYVIRAEGGTFSLPEVVNVYALDTPTSREIITRFSAAGGESGVYEVTPQTKRETLAREIRSLVFLVRIKLAEWRWWGQQEG